MEASLNLYLEAVCGRSKLFITISIEKVSLTYLQSELLINAPLKLNIEGVSG